MPKNQKNITIASYNYLYDVSAIPEKIRDEYLQTLFKRKDITKQKNIKLLLCIYSYINENRISEWNPGQICKNLEISMNALYLHKSRLLKGLREYYFNWKKIEQEIDNKNSGKICPIRINLEKALKMYEIGMRREAKRSFVKLEREIKNEALNPTEKNVIQTEIYKYICVCYCNTRNRKKLFYYYNELQNIILSGKKLNLNPRQKIIININLNFCRFYLFFRKTNKKKLPKSSRHYLDKIYSDAKKINDYDNLITVLYIKSILHLKSGNTEETDRLCREGYFYAAETGSKTQKYIFLALLHYIKPDTSNNSVMIKQFINHYNQIVKNEPLNKWTIQFLNTITGLYYPDRRKEIKEILNHHVNTPILIGDYSQAVFLRYEYESENFIDNIISYFLPEGIEDNGYLQINNIGRKLLDDMENLSVNTLCYHKAVNDTGIISKVYLNQLNSIFFNTDSPTRDKAGIIIRKLKWLKNNKKLVNINSFRLLKAGLKLLSPDYNYQGTFSKYKFSLLRVLDNFKNKPSDIKIMDYAVLASLAGRAKNKEITDIVSGFYHWLQTRHPEILAPVFREFKERESKIYTVSGAA